VKIRNARTCIVFEWGRRRRNEGGKEEEAESDEERSRAGK